MGNNRFTLFEGQTDFEDSLMRSVLLFGFSTSKGKREDRLRKAILSIVIYGKGKYDCAKITSIFNEKFSLNMTDKEIQHQLNILTKDGFVVPNEDGSFLAVDSDKKGVSYFDNLEKNTTAMIERIVGKVNKKHPLSQGQKDVVKKNAKQALSLYFQINGLTAVGMQEAKRLEEFKTVVDAALKNIDEKVGKYLVSVLAYTIEEPGEDKAVLEQWARAVVGMRSTSLDPLLRNFKQQQLASKKFVLDTDILLNALTHNARFSSDYHKIIGHLVKAGAKVLIPQFVYDEVVSNAENAIRKFNARGSQYIQYSDEALEDPQSNVFIEDYVKTIRKDKQKKRMNFVTYMGNIYSDRSPYTLNQNIIKLLGEKNGNNRYVLKENVLNEENASKLKDIIKERAMKTPKGLGRTLDQQEEMALNDTRLYLTICEENKEKEKQGILGYQCYLVTRSGRTIKSASDLGIYDKHVVCHPQTLIAVLDDIGQIGDVEIINLFDNPFLAYTTELIMDQVEPIIEAGAQIVYYDFIQLREKFDLNINEILTAKGVQMKELVDKYTKEGLLFAKDWDDLLKKTDKQEEELAKVKTRNDNLEKENKTLKGKLHYLEKTAKHEKGKKSTPKKKNKITKRKH